ncbi:45244_t:CDS:2 [Gigaspora margarita]|uniref:45244_t:CDS:1 n=1 Tax=Gigaspora margarita TaxID=4874 RepID=A0ABN7UVH1_GIGMA|nr:45244_t:CDS:2 [Gigaspora margarita]
MKSNGYHNNINHDKKHKYVPPNEKNDEIQDMFKVQNRQVLRKSINDDDASINLSEFQQSTDEFQPLTDNTYILNSKQSSCFDLTSKFEGFIFDNNIIKRASKRAFKIDIDKVESKTQLNNEITKVEKYNNKLDALFKRNLISCKNISNFLPFFIGDTFLQTLDSLATSECSYTKWEKEELNIPKSNIKPTEEFVKVVENALKSKDKETRLRGISKEYGDFYACRLVFGGAMIKEAYNEEILNIDNSQTSKIRVIGGIKEQINGFSLKPWIKSLNDRDVWDIIEYDEIYSIFDLLNDNLQKEVLDVLGYRVLKAGINDVPLNWDFSKNATYVHSLATQFADLDKITKVNNCYIFASIIDKNDRDIFSLRVVYVHEHMPLIVVHLKKSLHKKHKNSPIKVGWIIVGPPTNFDIDQTKCPVMIKSGEIEFFKSCTLNTCVLGLPEVNTKCLMHLSVYDINDINQLVNDEKVPQRTALFCW